MILPEHVNKNFSGSASSYDCAAVFQRRAANLLEKFIKKNHSPAVSPAGILEIGCGTGFMTEKILRLFPDSKFMISDISNDMLSACRNKIEADCKYKDLNVSFDSFDASKTIHGGNYDLIVSAMTFQWFADMKKSAELLYSKISEKGSLFFSTLESETFLRLRAVFDELGEPYPGPRFLSLADIEKSLSVFDDVILEKHRYSVKYNSLLEFLDSLSLTGAVNATGKIMKIPSLRRVIRHYSAKYPAVEEDYHLVLAACKGK